MFHSPARPFRATTVALLVGSLATGPMIVGCESLPGDEKSQGSVIGGIGGALAGAAVAGDDDRLVGALIGAVVGAGGGYLIGSEVGKRNDEKDREEALEAARKAEENPATAEDVTGTKTADLNDDGFVTMDEVVAMEEADLPDDEMIERLERTQQYFKLTESQEEYLRDKGVDDNVIVAMRDMKPEGAPDGDAVIASDRSRDRDDERDSDADSDSDSDRN